MTYDQWVARHPQAAAELSNVFTATCTYPAVSEIGDKSESYVQQQVRMTFARSGGMLWRNNVGATPAKETHKCPSCGFKFEVRKQPVRYGLCNDSSKLNKQFKFPDLIGIMPVTITPQHVGQTIGQFAGIEVKRPGWVFNPNDPHQQAQQRALHLLASQYAIAYFSTGG
jgi:hypothetical protein